MWNIFGHIFKNLKWNPVHKRNYLFRIGCYGTTILLLAFVIILTARAHVGDPITCTKLNWKLIAPKKYNAGKTFSKIFESYCLFEGAYTIFNNSGVMGKEVVYPGVGVLHPGDQIRRYDFYQFVGLFFLFLAICFNVAPLMWESHEKRIMKKIITVFKCSVYIDRDRETIVEYFVENLHAKNSFAYFYYFCEFLNFTNVLIQMYLTNVFINGGFLTYGIDVIFPAETEIDSTNNAMTRLFPSMTKCSFYKYGRSGNIETIDVTCLLPLQATIRRMFLLLWFWFVTLMVLFGVALIYRVITIGSSSIRFARLKMCAKFFPLRKLKAVYKSCQIGDWFILCQLSKDVDTANFNQFLDDVYVQIAGIKKCEDHVD